METAAMPTTTTEKGIVLTTLKGNDRSQKISSVVLDIDTTVIAPYSKQPRKKITEKSVRRLAKSINKDGQREPGQVCMYYGTDPSKKYYLIDGERRYRACLFLGITFRAIVKHVKDEKDHRRQAAIANFHHQVHNAMEIAHVIHDFRLEYDMTYEEIEEDTGMSKATLIKYESLVHLHPDLQALLDPELPSRERLPIGKAVELARLPPREQLSMYHETKGQSADQAWLHMRKAIDERGIVERHGERGKKRKPSDDFERCITRLSRILKDLRFINQVPDEWVRRALAGRNLPANTELLGTLTAIMNERQNLLGKIKRCLPENHRKKVI